MSDHDPQLASPVDRIAMRLESRFRVRGALPWGYAIPYVRVDSEVGPLVVAAPQLDCEGDPELERWFMHLAFGLAGLPGSAFPRIVRYGVADGLPFLAYRPPIGRTLADSLRRGPLSSRSVLRLLERVLDAFAVAHRHALVHGELRPENVLVDESGERLVVTVLGVGLLPILLEARKREGERRSGAAPALSSYRAPELYAGDPPTIASDIFALGALIHHMVSGRAPGGFETADAYSDLPALLDVVRRAMAPEPEDRYASVDAMRAAIDWVEIESEKLEAHTQDIPLWMEHSKVGNIPVPDLLRGRASSRPPRSDRPLRPSGYDLVADRVPPAPRVPRISEPPVGDDVFAVHPPQAVESDSTTPGVCFDLGVDPRTRPSTPSIPHDSYLPLATSAGQRPRSRTPLWVEPLLVVIVVCLATALGFVLAR